MSDDPELTISVETPEAAEVEAEALTEAVEAAAEAEVQIAEIEAEAAVALAEIHAEVEVAHIEAQAERTGEVWQNIEALQAGQLTLAETLGEMQGTLQSIQAQLTPAEPSPPSLPSGEEVVLPVEETPAAAPEPPAKPKKSRWI